MKNKWHLEYIQAPPVPVLLIDYRCDNSPFWLSAHNFQVPTPTSQNIDAEQKIRIFEQTNSSIAWKIKNHHS